MRTVAETFNTSLALEATESSISWRCEEVVNPYATPRRRVGAVSSPPQIGSVLDLERNLYSVRGAPGRTYKSLGSRCQEKSWSMMGNFSHWELDLVRSVGPNLLIDDGAPAVSQEWPGARSAVVLFRGYEQVFSYRSIARV